MSESGGDYPGPRAGWWRGARLSPGRWLEGRLTPGQRWTAGLALTIAVAVVAFGGPRITIVPAAETAAPPPTGTAAATVPNGLVAFPPVNPSLPPVLGALGISDLLPSPEATPTPAAEQTAAPPPSPTSEPVPPPGPCQLDTGLPAPVTRTVVDALATTETTLAGVTRQPAPVDLAGLLASLAGCPPPPAGSAG